jgi:hypothetical protein
MKMAKARKIASQAVIVITILGDGTMCIRTDNGGRSHAAKVADAIVHMSAAVMKDKTLADAAAKEARP